MHPHRFHSFDRETRTITLKFGWGDIKEFLFAKDLSFPTLKGFSQGDPVEVVFERMDWGEDRIVILEKAAPQAEVSDSASSTSSRSG